MRTKAFLLVIATVFQAISCTAFLMNQGGRFYVGKNYDWQVESGLIIQNKRNIEKTAFGVKNPAKWVSKYGSISFCQYGHDFPCGGMNEQGLVIEVLWLDESVYEEKNSSEIDNMQWVQFQLDNSATVSDVLLNDSLVCIRPISPTAVHYFVADKSGRAAVIEFINGEKKVYSHIDNSLMVPVLTNTPFDESVQMIKQSKAFGGLLEVSEGEGSVSQFIRAGAMISETKVSEEPIDRAFSILESSKISRLTAWSIVYDLENSNIYYCTKSKKARKLISMKEINFDCSSPAYCIDIVNGYKGRIDKNFYQFTTDVNHENVSKAIKRTPFLKSMQNDFIRAISYYPQEMKCAEGSLRPVVR